MASYQGYTDNAWKGDKYEATHDLPLKEIAKRIKKEALAKYGDKIKLSVKTDHFANGCSIDATITGYNGELFSEAWREYKASGQNIFFDAWLRDSKYSSQSPRHSEELQAILKDIEAIGNQYNRSDCDGMIDYFDVNFYWNVGIDWQLEK